jgi:5-methyltetrahydrofolate--homocysteine methyltransferase
MAMSAGLDCAIVDVMDCDLIGAVKASEALLGKDRFCKNYIKAFRDGKGL